MAVNLSPLVQIRHCQKREAYSSFPLHGSLILIQMKGFFYSELLLFERGNQQFIWSGPLGLARDAAIQRGMFGFKGEHVCGFHTRISLMIGSMSKSSKVLRVSY
jgi:hypothetical protein